MASTVPKKPFDTDAALVGVGGVTAIVDAIDTPNKYGRQSVGTNALKGVASGAAAGAQFGPIGAAIGAGVGGLTGLVSGIKQKQAEKGLILQDNNLQRRMQLDQYAARAAQDPDLITGTKGEEYFAMGGSLRTEYMRQKANGGTLSKLSSDTVEVKGPSHAAGGVDLPGTNAEVEGGETIKGDYVLSKKLGFAQLHKPIAKVIGLLEQKPVTRSTMGSLERLRKQEQALILMQEFVKHKNNLQ